ncbi:MAG: hypothetical protein IPM47_07010 [Sphingobacteriales bacterium]|nr:MAG: hypothetical protein IPM47_07010 [Sphingobacteriales bacterium]
MNSFRLFGIIGIVAAMLGITADLLLLYVPNGGYEKWDYQFFTQISPERIYWGHLIGVLCIPFELAGFWQVYKSLEPAGRKWVIPVLLPIVVVTIWGVAYHAMLAGLAAYMRLQANAALPLELSLSTFQHLKATIEPLGYLLFFLFVYISVGLFYLIRFKNTYYPRWTAWVNPLLIYIAAVGLYLLFPQHIGSMAIVAGFNLSIFIVLSTSTIVLWKR